MMITLLYKVCRNLFKSLYKPTAITQSILPISHLSEFCTTYYLQFYPQYWAWSIQFYIILSQLVSLYRVIFLRVRICTLWVELFTCCEHLSLIESHLAF